jgi:hypothetical protein
MRACGDTATVELSLTGARCEEADMVNVHWLCLVVAFVFFVCGAFSLNAGRFNWMLAGFAMLTLSLLI